jgi:predicted GNAT family acetyltransferase
MKIPNRANVHIFQDCQQYIDTCTAFMAADPFTTNVIGVHVSGILAGSRIQGANDIFIALLDLNNVVGMAMHTPPHNLFISRMSGTAASELAKFLFKSNHAIPGVTGEKTAVTAFKETWNDLTHTITAVLTQTRMYRLDRLSTPTGVEGSARAATSKDIDLVRQWLTDFTNEATPHNLAHDIDITSKRRINGGEIQLWANEREIVSLAGCSSAVCGVSRIGPVYTPKEFRGHGYGSAVTAAATQSAFDRGAQYVALYTDLSNPTSNAIYQSIGYIPDHDGQECSFNLGE